MHENHSFEGKFQFICRKCYALNIFNWLLNHLTSSASICYYHYNVTLIKQETLHDFLQLLFFSLFTYILMYVNDYFNNKL